VKRILFVLVALIPLCACATLYVQVDVYDPKEKPYAETATAQNFRAFATYFENFVNEEKLIKERIGQIEAWTQEGVRTCTESAKINEQENKCKKSFDDYRAERKNCRKELIISFNRRWLRILRRRRNILQAMRTSGWQGWESA